MSSRVDDLNSIEKLPSTIGFFSAFLLLVGSVIGSGVFLVASDIAQSLASPAQAVGVWVIAGLISLAGALIFAELGALYPFAGGQYVFLQKAYHPIVSFFFGWTLVLVIQTGSIAAVAVGFARFLSHFVEMNSDGIKMTASTLIVALTVFNFMGVKRGLWLLDSVTSLKIIALVGLGAVCLFMVHRTGVSFPKPAVEATASFHPEAYGVALIAAFWSYDGWANLSFVASEVKTPERNLPLASFLGIACVTALYALVNWGYYRVLSVDEIARSSFVAGDAANRVLGDAGSRWLTFFVIISALGCVNAQILSGARVLYAMGADRSLPAFIARVGRKSQSPNVALALQGLWTLVLVWSGSYDQLFTYVIFAAFLFYGLTAYAVIRLRTIEAQTIRSYRVPFYPVLPLAYVAFTGWFMVNSMISKPKESLAGVAILISGLPVYYLMRRVSKQRDIENIKA